MSEAEKKLRPYEMTARDLDAAGEFMRRINAACDETGVGLEPGCGMLTIEGRIVGYLRWSNGGLIFDGSAGQ